MKGDTRDLKVIAEELQSGGMKCNWDLDNWEPEIATGHTHVCRIRKRAFTMKFRPSSLPRASSPKTAIET